MVLSRVGELGAGHREAISAGEIERCTQRFNVRYNRRFQRIVLGFH